MQTTESESGQILHEPTHNRAPIISLLTANTISQIGSMLTIVALPWFVLQTTGSAAKTGLTGVFAALPFIVAGIFCGAPCIDSPGLGYSLRR